MLELLKKMHDLNPCPAIHSRMAVEQGAQQQWRRIGPSAGGVSISALFLLLSLSTSIIFAKLSKNLFKNGRLLRHSYEAMQGGPCIEVDKQPEPSLH